MEDEEEAGRKKKMMEREEAGNTRSSGDGRGRQGSGARTSGRKAKVAEWMKGGGYVRWPHRGVTKADGREVQEEEKGGGKEEGTGHDERLTVARCGRWKVTKGELKELGWGAREKLGMDWDDVKS